MVRNISYKAAYNYYLAFFAAVMIVVPHFVAIAILPLVVFVIIGSVRKHLQFKLSPIGVLFLLLYLSYAIGTIYTNNTDIASKYLEYKLSFIIFPILFFFPFRKGGFSLQKLILGLIIGVTLIGIYGFYNSLGCYLDGGTSCFFTVIISPIHHPTYLVAFMMLAMGGSWMGYQKKWAGYKLSWIIPFTFFVLIYHILTQSLAGILFMLLIIASLILVFIFKKWGRIAGLVSCSLVPIVLYLIVNFVPYIEGEFNHAKWYADIYISNPSEFVSSRVSPMTGTEQRLVMWTVAAEEFSSNIMGAGTGNVDDVLGARLRALDKDTLADKQFNPHNQYLQTGVEIGIIGLLILISIILYGFYFAIKQRNWLLFILVANIAFNCLFESMLQRQSGIVFYTFWMCIFAVIEYKKPNETSDSNTILST